MALKFTYARVWNKIALSLDSCYDWVGLLKTGRRDLLPLCSLTYCLNAFNSTFYFQGQMLDVTCWVDSSYEAFTGWKCLFLLFQLLLTNPFLFIIFSIKKERSSLNCFVIENEIISKKKEKIKEQPVLCSSARCRCSPLILASYWRTGDFGVGSNKPDPQLEVLNLLQNNCVPIVLGEICLSWLSLGELQEGIQASRKLASHRSILLCHSHSPMMVNKREIVLSACGSTTVLFAVWWQQILSCWHRALAQGKFGWLSAQRFPFLLADLGGAPHCKGPLCWVLQCCGVISDNAPVSHPSLSPHLCSCREELTGFSWLIKHALLDSKLHSLLLNISQEQLCSGRVWMAQQFCIHFQMKWF